MKQVDMFADLLPELPKIYESPDGGKTIYERDFGSPPESRVAVKVSEPASNYSVTYNFSVNS